MEKSIYSPDHQRLSRLLREARHRAGLRQSDVAARLDVNQTFVSKYEKGERRLDLVELQRVCEALGVSLVEFVEDYVRAGAEEQR